MARSNDIHHCHGCRGRARFAGIGVPFVELGIALSVAVLGAVVAFDFRARTAAAMGIVGLFATFHGHAHGAEIPQHVGGVAYAAGFAIATALLYLTESAPASLSARQVSVMVLSSCD